MKNELIKVLYGKASQEEKDSLKNEMEFNFELREEMQQLTQAKEMLDTVKKSPHPSSIKIILEHSLRKCPEPTL